MINLKGADVCRKNIDGLSVFGGYLRTNPPDRFTTHLNSFGNPLGHFKGFKDEKMFHWVTYVQ